MRWISFFLLTGNEAADVEFDQTTARTWKRDLMRSFGGRSLVGLYLLLIFIPDENIKPGSVFDFSIWRETHSQQFRVYTNYRQLEEIMRAIGKKIENPLINVQSRQD